MGKIGVLLTVVFIGLTGFSMVYNQSKEKEDNHMVKGRDTNCLEYEDVIRIVDKLDAMLKDDNQLAYDEIKNFLEKVNGFTIDAKQIIKGYWVPIDDRAAAARSRHKNIIYFFNQPGTWFVDKSNQAESIEVSQPYANTLVLIKGGKIVNSSELKLMEKCLAVRIVVWVKGYVLNVDLNTKNVVIYNRGS